MTSLVSRARVSVNRNILNASLRRPKSLQGEDDKTECNDKKKL